VRVTVFSVLPDLLSGYTQAGVLARAVQGGPIELSCVDLREYGQGVHRSVDDAPFGGGAGMVMTCPPIFEAVEATDAPRPLFAMSATGRPFNQAMAEQLAGLDGLSLLCGRYEGIDQRVLDHLVDGEISIGDYVLAGGELAALVILETVARLLPGVLGNESSIDEESFSDGLIEYPQFTRPAYYRDLGIPPVLTSGDHGRVARWRRAASLARTLERRPDLIARRGGLSQLEVGLLVEHGYAVGPTDLISEESPRHESD
jgi:tRNA (guanine37-N1)-methyltransferase